MRDFPRWLDALFSTALSIERAAIRMGISLPFGGSLIVVLPYATGRRAMAEVSAPALSVVVPVYNGAGTVGELVGALRDPRYRGRLLIGPI